MLIKKFMIIYVILDYFILLGDEIICIGSKFPSFVFPVDCRKGSA